MISYGKAERAYGVNATSQLIVNPAMTVYNVKSYLGLSSSNFDQKVKDQTRFKTRFEDASSPSSPLLIPIPSSSLIPSSSSDESDQSINEVGLRVEQIAASLIKRYSSYAQSDLLYWQYRKKIVDRERRKRLQELTGDQVKGMKIKKVVLSIPDNYSPAQSAALIDAAEIAGLDVINVLPDSLSTSLAYSLLNNTSFKEEGREEKVVIIDVGHSHLHSSISHVKYNSMETIARNGCEEGVGAEFERLVYQWAEEEIRKKYKKQIESNGGGEGLPPRAKAKLERAVQKGITVLSTIPHTIIEVDSLLPDLNVQLDLTRSHFEIICAPALNAVETSLQSLLSKADPPIALDDPSLRIEVLGGASRIPSVQDRIRKQFNGKELSRSLDSNASTSIGASLFGSLFQSSDQSGEEEKYKVKDLDLLLTNGKAALASSDRLSSPLLSQFIQFENQLCDRDENEKKFQDMKNSYEQYIYSYRDYANQAISQSKISNEDLATCLKILAEEEDWLIYESPDSQSMSFASLESRFASFKENLAKEGAKLDRFVNDLLAEKLRQEKEAEEAEAKREVTYRDKVANPITPKERLDAAVKRKDQGNDCFKDINYEHAIQRYKQALTLLMEIPGDKFSDEIQQTKLTCYLNLSMCYLNLKKYSFAVDNCESALRIDEKNVKAFFRMGKANYALKKYEDAKKNFSSLLQLEPENKDAIKQLALTDKAIKIQQENEKKMYANMFA